MARALSVREEKGLVSWVASQSSDGTAWRGNVAAWESGAEKSRHFRHDGEEDVPCEMGLVTGTFERSGREERGT